MRLIAAILVFIFHLENTAQDLIVQSTAFANRHYIPYRYTCDAENINPALRISGIPHGTKSLVLIMLDTSAAFGVFDHWLVWNIPPTGRIDENSSPGVTGWNSRKENKYTGPCPPNGRHEYRFRVYALDIFLNLSANNHKEAVLKAIRGHVLAKGELTGLFQRE